MHLHVSSLKNPDLKYTYLKISQYTCYWKTGLHPYDKTAVSMLLRKAPVFIEA